MRQVGDAEAVEKLRDGVAAKRDEAPEDERVREAGGRPLGDGLALQHDVDEEPLNPEPEAIEREGIRGGRDQADARRDLRGEDADEDDDEQPEDERGHDDDQRRDADDRREQPGAALCRLRRARRARRVHATHAFSAATMAGTISNRSPTIP